MGLSKTIAKEWGSYGVRANTVAFGLIETRLVQELYSSQASMLTVLTVTSLSLTASKEAGAFIDVDGKKVALGIPGGGVAAANGKPIPGIPLGRAATPDEAAASVLLYELAIKSCHAYPLLTLPFTV